MEIELKLALEPDAVALLRRHPLLAHYRQRRPRSAWLENRYFDTPALDLHRQGLELRLRREGARCVQTLKVLRGPRGKKGAKGTKGAKGPGGSNAAGGLHRREEWDVELGAPALDIAALLAVLPAQAAAAGRQLQAFAAAGQLECRVTTRYRRTTWQLVSAGGDEVELVLDIGSVHAGGQVLPLCEVELELKAGEERSLFELAAALHADLPLRPEARGKAERGFALLAPLGVATASAPRHARPMRIKRTMTWADALQAIIEECLQHMQNNEAGVVGSADVEHVHQMRVGLRRLRSALGLFKRFAAVPAALREDLRWLADQLGQARDAEVLAHETLARVQLPAAGQIGWSALRSAAIAEAEAARRAAVQAVLSRRHAGWPLALRAWVLGLRAQDADERLRTFAQRELHRLWVRLKKRGERLVGANSATRHDTRIAAKKLRYASEMLGAVRARRAPRPALRALAALQQELGVLNDAEVAKVRLARLAAATAVLAPAAAYAQGWITADAERRVRALGKLWLRVRGSR